MRLRFIFSIVLHIVCLQVNFSGQSDGVDGGKLFCRLVAFNLAVKEVLKRIGVSVKTPGVQGVVCGLLRSLKGGSLSEGFSESLCERLSLIQEGHDDAVLYENIQEVFKEVRVFMLASSGGLNTIDGFRKCMVEVSGQFLHVAGYWYKNSVFKDALALVVFVNSLSQKERKVFLGKNVLMQKAFLLAKEYVLMTLQMYNISHMWPVIKKMSLKVRGFGQGALKWLGGAFVAGGASAFLYVYGHHSEVFQSLSDFLVKGFGGTFNNSAKAAKSFLSIQGDCDLAQKREKFVKAFELAQSQHKNLVLSKDNVYSFGLELICKVDCEGGYSSIFYKDFFDALYTLSNADIIVCKLREELSGGGLDGITNKMLMEVFNNVVIKDFAKNVLAINPTENLILLKKLCDGLAIDVQSKFLCYEDFKKLETAFKDLYSKEDKKVDSAIGGIVKVLVGGCGKVPDEVVKKIRESLDSSYSQSNYSELLEKIKKHVLVEELIIGEKYCSDLAYENRNKNALFLYAFLLDGLQLGKDSYDVVCGVAGLLEEEGRDKNVSFKELVCGQRESILSAFKELQTHIKKCSNAKKNDIVGANKELQTHIKKCANANKNDIVGAKMWQIIGSTIKEKNIMGGVVVQRGLNIRGNLIAACNVAYSRLLFGFVDECKSDNGKIFLEGACIAFGLKSWNEKYICDFKVDRTAYKNGIWQAVAIYKTFGDIPKWWGKDSTKYYNLSYVDKKSLDQVDDMETIVDKYKINFDNFYYKEKAFKREVLSVRYASFGDVEKYEKTINLLEKNACFKEDYLCAVGSLVKALRHVYNVALRNQDAFKNNDVDSIAKKILSHNNYGGNAPDSDQIKVLKVVTSYIEKHGLSFKGSCDEFVSKVVNYSLIGLTLGDNKIGLPGDVLNRDDCAVVVKLLCGDIGSKKDIFTQSELQKVKENGISFSKFFKGESDLPFDLAQNLVLAVYPSLGSLKDGAYVTIFSNKCRDILRQSLRKGANGLYHITSAMNILLKQKEFFVGHIECLIDALKCENQLKECVFCWLYEDEIKSNDDDLFYKGLYNKVYSLYGCDVLSKMKEVRSVNNELKGICDDIIKRRKKQGGEIGKDCIEQSYESFFSGLMSSYEKVKVNLSYEVNHYLKDCVAWYSIKKGSLICGSQPIKDTSHDIYKDYRNDFKGFATLLSNLVLFDKKIDKAVFDGESFYGYIKADNIKTDKDIRIFIDLVLERACGKGYSMDKPLGIFAIRAVQGCLNQWSQKIKEQGSNAKIKSLKDAIEKYFGNNEKNKKDAQEVFVEYDSMLKKVSDFLGKNV